MVNLYLSIVAVIPYFCITPTSMYSEDGGKTAKLKPSYKQFMICFGCVLIERSKETSHILRPMYAFISIILFVEILSQE